MKLSKLTEVSVYPKSLDRKTKSFHLLAIFCNETSTLKIHSDLENNDGTVNFTPKSTGFWKIVNVHTPYGDTCLRDLNRAVTCTPNDENLQKLN